MLRLIDRTGKKDSEIYKKANCTDRAIKVILYFNEAEYVKVNGILNGFMLNLLEEYQC